MLLVIAILFSGIHSVQAAPLSIQERQDFYHLSEGSDVYPYDWLVRIKSAYEHDRTGNWERGYFDGIESRMNILKNSESNPYLLDFVGLSTAWSGHGSEVSDAMKSDAGSQLRWVGSTPSVRMTGINCAFCHTGAVTVNGVQKVVDGSQGTVNVQRLYEDMLVSTIMLVYNSDDLLEDFLVSFDYPRDEARKLAKAFAKQTLKETSFKTKMQLLAKQFGLMKSLGPRVFAGEVQNIARHFERLLRLTHRLGVDQDIGNELRKKFEFLAGFAGGSPKFTTQGGTVHSGRFYKSNDGFGRLEAFVSAGNRVFRERDDWVSVNNPVGLPPVWGMDHRAIFHYTGNTNTTFIRNIGQALSLGAVLLDDEKHSAAKIENIGKLEKIASRMDSPKWDDYHEVKIDRVMADRGKIHFKQNCAGCHEPKQVGPQKNLDYYPVINLEKIGTDPNLALNAVKPIREGVSYSSMFVSTMQGILETYQKDHPERRDQVRAWRELDKRGDEWIRETYQGTEEQHQGAEYGLPKVSKGAGYVTRPLQGVWATAPYLHNNSVPTLWDLLQTASKRPVMFERGVNEFDAAKVGVAQSASFLSSEVSDCESRGADFAAKVWKVDVCFDTRLSGNSNRGHEKGIDLKDSEKMELIEYLKTL